MEMALIMGLLGFQTASQSRLKQILPTIKCDGNTAFRDAVIKGNQLMLQLYSEHCKHNMQDHFKFVHVVLTDGEDNRSQISLNEFLKYQIILQTQLPDNILQTFYIGVNVENNKIVKQEMELILQFSGNSAKYYPISSNGINEIFQKIQMQIRMQVQQRAIVIGNQEGTISLKQQQIQPVFQVQINNYIVLFTLDISGSMSLNWDKVCTAVNGFLNNLDSNDLVLGIVFNEQVKVLSQDIEEISSYNEKSNFKDYINIKDIEYNQPDIQSDPQEIPLIDDNDDEDKQQLNQSDIQSVNNKLPQIQQKTQETPQPSKDPQDCKQPIQQSQPQTQRQTQPSTQIQETIQQTFDKPQNQSCSCQINCQIF